MMAVAASGWGCLGVQKSVGHATRAPGGRSLGLGRLVGSEEDKRRISVDAQTVLVTGGAGFVGSHVAEILLRQGMDVVIVDDISDTQTWPAGSYGASRKRHNLELLLECASEDGAGAVHVVEAGVADRAAMEEVFSQHPIDRVAHIGARAGVRPSLECPEDYVEANVTGTTILLDLACKASCSNFVYASSSSVYGERSDGGKGELVPFLETDPADLQVSPYATTKRCCELMAATYSSLHALPTTGLRFFTVYGPRGRPDMALLKFVGLALEGKKVQQYGDGSSWRDYTYIQDVAEGVVQALDTPQPCCVLNMGFGSPVRLRDFISTLRGALEAAGHPLEVEVVGDRLGDVGGTYADISLAEKTLGYSARVPLSEGLQRTVDWYLASEWAPVQKAEG